MTVADVIRAAAAGDEACKAVITQAVWEYVRENYVVRDTEQAHAALAHRIAIERAERQPVVNVEASADGVHFMPVTLGPTAKDMSGARFVRAPQSVPERTER